MNLLKYSFRIIFNQKKLRTAALSKRLSLRMSLWLIGSHDSLKTRIRWETKHRYVA